MDKLKIVSVHDLSEACPSNSKNHKSTKYQNQHEKKCSNVSDLPLFSTLSENSSHSSKKGMNEMPNLQKSVVTQNKNFQSAINSEAISKTNENGDYNMVIKQFDDLISELSNKELIKGDNKFSKIDNLCDIVQEKKDIRGSDTGNFKSFDSAARNFTKESTYNKRMFTNINPSIVKYDASEKKLETVNKHVAILEKDCDEKEKKLLNDHSMKETLFFEADKHISWINSNLWHRQNDKNVCKLQKPIPDKTKECIPVTDNFIDSKEVSSHPPKSINPSEHGSILNQTGLYSVLTMKDQTAKYSGSKSNPKCCKSFPYSEAYFKEICLRDPSLQFQRCKIGKPNLWPCGTVDKSPKMGRHPMHKYVSDNCFMVNLLIETKNSHLGPFTFEIYSRMTLRLLKLKVEQEYGIPTSSQRWILGKYFAADNDKSLVEYNVVPGSVIILYVDNSGLACNTSERTENTSCQLVAHKTKEMSVMNRTLENEPSNIISENLENEPKSNEVKRLPRDISHLKNCELHFENDSSHIAASKEVSSYDFLDSQSEQKCNLTSVVKSPAVKKKGLKKDLLSKKTKIKSVEKQTVLNNDNMEKLFMESKSVASEQKNDTCSDIPINNLSEKQSEFYREENILPNLIENLTVEESKISDINMLQTRLISQSENILQNNSDILLKDDSLFSHNQTAVACDAMDDYFSYKESKGPEINPDEHHQNFMNSDLQTQTRDIKQNSSHSNFFSVVDKEVGIALGSNDPDKNEDIKYSSVSECNTEGTYSVKDSENQILSALIQIQKSEKSDQFHNIHGNDNQSATNSRRSGTSIIRRLSMTRKANSKSDSDNSGNTSMVKRHKEEKIDESGSVCFVQKPDYNYGLYIENSHADSDNSFIKMHNNEKPNNIDPHLLIYNSSLECSHADSEDSNSSYDKMHGVVKADGKGSNQNSENLCSENNILEYVHAKVDDDSSSSDDMSFITVQSDEKIEEKDYNPSASDAYSASFNDIHIEISVDPEIIPTGNEDVDFKDETQVDPIVPDTETVKNLELLLEIENMDLVQNTMNFFCPVCFEEFESGQGVVLHDCLHTFCRDCLSNSVIYAEGALVKCPYRDDLYSCQSHLQQREIKALVSEDEYEKYLQRSIITAEGLAESSFHCKSPDCPGWCIYDNIINIFHCPVCSHFNCLNCQAIHEGLNCRQYQEKLKIQQKVDQDAEKTLQLLNKMIENGKALKCPKCDLILMKKWGCDWLKCSICQTEICWITKGPRWGPGGQGDTSGGCRCGVNGVKCHPSCTYCH